MKFICDKPVMASLDDGLTVTTFPPHQEHDVPEWVGAVAVQLFGAKEVKPRQNSKAKSQKGK